MLLRYNHNTILPFEFWLRKPVGCSIGTCSYTSLERTTNGYENEIGCAGEWKKIQNSKTYVYACQNLRYIKFATVSVCRGTATMSVVYRPGTPNKDAYIDGNQKKPSHLNNIVGGRSITRLRSRNTICRTLCPNFSKPMFDLVPKHQ
jgi:hypothetical protein